MIGSKFFIRIADRDVHCIADRIRPDDLMHHGWFIYVFAKVMLSLLDGVM